MKQKLKQMTEKLVAALLTVALAGTMQIGSVKKVQAASSGTCGAPSWILSDSGLLHIRGTGKMMNYDYKGSPFYKNSRIKTIIIDEGVTTIGTHAFYACGCMSVTIPDTVVSIGEGAFRSTELVKVEIPGSVKTISESAFRDSRIKNVVLNEGLETLGGFNYTPISEITIPDSVQTIDKECFYECDKLESVNMGSGVKTIGYMAFRRCSSLKSIYIPDSVQSVGEGAFYDSGLAKVSLPTSVMSIGAFVFDGTNVKDMELRIVNNAEILNAKTYMTGGMAVGIPTVTSYKLGKMGTVLNSSGSSMVIASSTDETDTITVPDGEKAMYVNCLESDGSVISGVESNLYIVGSELPTASKEGYVFDGWYSNAALTGNAITSIQEDSPVRTVYARWRHDIGKDSVTIESVEDQDYTGSSTVPTILVKDAGVELKENIDYTAEVISRDNEREHTSDGWNSGEVTIKVTGIGKYANSRKVVYNVNKLEGQLSLAESYETTYTYNGKNLSNPSKNMIIYNNTDSDAGVVYTWYAGNYSIQEPEKFAVLQKAPKNAGTYTLVITVPETRNYKKAEVRKVVRIEKAKPKASFSNMMKVFSYCGNKYSMDRPVITLVNNERYNGSLNYYYKTEGAGYKIGLPTEVGVYTVKCVIPETENYTSVETSNTVQVTINKKKVTFSDGSLKVSKVYDGEKAFSLDQITGKLELNGVVEGDDVTVKVQSISDADTADVGTKTVALALKISGKDISNYSFASTNYEFTKATITKANLKVSGIETKELVYGQKLSESEITGDVRFGTNRVSGTWRFKTPNYKPTVADSETTTFDLIFTPDDGTNFNEVLASTTVVVHPSLNTPNCPNGRMEVLYSVKILGDVALTKNWVWATDLSSVLEVGRTFTATARYNGPDQGNYSKETCTVLITRQACTHPSTELKNAKKASCYEEGYTGDIYCQQCKELLYTGKPVVKKTHTPVTDAAVEATCSQTGLTEGSHCSVCHTVLVGQKPVDKKPHTVVIDNRVEATCTKSGLTEGSHCSVCKEVFVKQNVIKAKGHTEETDAQIDATCTKSGWSKRVYCSTCNVVFKERKRIPAKGHLVVTDAAVEATCTKNGCTESSYCAQCNQEFSKKEIILAKGHTPVSDGAVEATCTKEGLTDYVYCSECETVLVEQKVIPTTPHAWDQGIVEKEATETEEGTICYTCTHCGTTKKESIPVKEPSGITGDANGDGKVDLADAQLLLKIALKITFADESELYVNDVDNNGTVDLSDAQLTLKVALKILDAFPEKQEQ